MMTLMIYKPDGTVFMQVEASFVMQSVDYPSGGHLITYCPIPDPAKCLMQGEPDLAKVEQIEMNVPVGWPVSVIHYKDPVQEALDNAKAGTDQGPVPTDLPEPDPGVRMPG